MKTTTETTLSRQELLQSMVELKEAHRTGWVNSREFEEAKAELQEQWDRLHQE